MLPNSLSDPVQPGTGMSLPRAGSNGSNGNPGLAREDLSSLLEAAPDALLVTNAGGDIVLVNGQAERLFGYSRDELLGRRIDVLFPEQFPDGLIGDLAGTGLAPGDPPPVSEYELVAQHKGGSEFPAEINLSCLKTEGGALVCMSIRSAADRRRMGTAARMLGTVVESTADTGGFERSLLALGLVDESGRFLRVNRAACELLGRADVEILGRDILEVLGPKSAHNVGGEGEKMSASPGDAGRSRLPMELRCVLPSGVVVWVEETVLPVPVANAAPATSFVQLRDITRRRQSDRVLEYQSLHDSLTGLANGTLLMSSLEESLARSRLSGQTIGVLFFTIDKLKQISDAYGRNSGDRLVLDAVRQMKSIVRGADTLARFDGGEFVIVCENVTVSTTQRLLERIVKLDKMPFVIDGLDVPITVTAGIASADGHQDAATIIGQAESALHDAMTRGRGQSSQYSEVTHRVSADQFTLELELGQALGRHELRIHYQPVIVLPRCSVVGFEALVRWQHPTRGLLAPGEFIPIAEESGLIVPIGEWVLRQAAEQVRSWQGVSPRGRPLTMAVNLSILQACDPDLVGVVRGVLDHTGLVPSTLHLEITESMMIQDAGPAMETLRALHALGVKLSVDDVGTGYASLSYLRTLPVDTVKIDKSFVDSLFETDARSLSIIAAIVGLSRVLRIGVIAEGVESREQLLELERIGMPFAQGYLFSRALPAEEIMPWVRHFESGALA